MPQKRAVANQHCRPTMCSFEKLLMVMIPCLLMQCASITEQDVVSQFKANVSDYEKAVELASRTPFRLFVIGLSIELRLSGSGRESGRDWVHIDISYARNGDLVITNDMRWIIENDFLLTEGELQWLFAFLKENKIKYMRFDQTSADFYIPSSFVRGYLIVKTSDPEGIVLERELYRRSLRNDWILVHGTP